MANNAIISEHLDETGGYSDIKVPVIITSGESLTPFFINAEKHCRDKDISSFLKANGEDHEAIIKHAIDLTTKHPEFKEDIEILANEVDYLFNKNESGRPIAIAGGQRRDWIFSGPVADVLGIAHISLYKQKIGQRKEDDKVIVSMPLGDSYQAKELDFYVVHSGDLATKGSSTYSIDKQTGREIGWVPMLRDLEAEVNDSVVVVSRLQGAEEMLLGLKPPVNLHSLVATDEGFLKGHSKQPDTAFAYVKSETEWTKNYLMQNGIDVLVPYFEPGNKNLDRGKKFYSNYGHFLSESEKILDLDKAVKERYGKYFLEIVGGK